MRFTIHAILIVCLSALPMAACAAGYMISVSPSPSCIPADGKSYSQILVTLFDQAGSLAPDGTEVRLTTTAGEITAAAYTSGGRAAGVLTSPSSAQIAMVTATAGGASGVAQVEFLSTDEAAVAGARTIRVSADSLVYSVERDVLMASGKVSIECRGVVIESMCAQVCQQTGVIRAQGDVVIKNGSHTVAGDALSCRINAGAVQVRALDGRIQSLDLIRLGRPTSGPPSTVAPDFAPLDTSATKTWIMCRRAVITPSDRILFYGATIYVGESKVIKLPYYSYSYENRKSILQQVQYSSGEGLLVDLPLYYQMADSSVGSVKLRYADKGDAYGGYFRPRKGLSLGLEQTYSAGGMGQGRLFVDALAASSRSFELAHHLDTSSRSGPGRADLTLRYQPSSLYARGIYNASLNVGGSLGGYDYTLSGYFSGSRIPRIDFTGSTLDYADQSDCSVRAVFRPRTPLLPGSKVRVSPSMSLVYGSLGLGSRARTSCLYQSFDLACSYSLFGGGARGCRLTGNSSLITTAEGRTGLNLRFGPSMRTYWNGGSADLGYTLNATAGSVNTLSTLSKHNLTGVLTLNGGAAWNAIAFADYGVDKGQLSLTSMANCNLARHWQVRGSLTFYRCAYNFSGRTQVFETMYRKAGLYHPLGPYEVGVAMSPDGQDIGLKGGRRIWLEFGAR